jgi:hypothetical protein
MWNGIVSSIRQPMTAFRYSFRFVRPGRHRGLCINSLCPSQTPAVVYAALSVWQLAPTSRRCSHPMGLLVPRGPIRYDRVSE